MNDKKDIYWQMYADVWKWHKKYFPGICDKQEWWNEYVAAGKAISKRYGECKFVINLVLGEIDEAERVWKKQKESEVA